MKKVILMFACAAIMMTACKKETNVLPFNHPVIGSDTDSMVAKNPPLIVSVAFSNDSIHNRNNTVANPSGHAENVTLFHYYVMNHNASIMWEQQNSVTLKTTVFNTPSVNPKLSIDTLYLTDSLGKTVAKSIVPISKTDSVVVCFKAFSYRLLAGKSAHFTVTGHVVYLTSFPAHVAAQCSINAANLLNNKVSTNADGSASRYVLTTGTVTGGITTFSTR